MKLSDFDQYLTGVIQPQNLSALIHDELADHLEAAKERGRLLPVIVDQNSLVKMTTEKFAVLLSHYIQGDLTATELAYIADVIQLSESVEVSPSKLNDFIFEMGDPEINGVFTAERAKEILRGLAT